MRKLKRFAATKENLQKHADDFNFTGFFFFFFKSCSRLYHRWLLFSNIIITRVIEFTRVSYCFFGVNPCQSTRTRAVCCKDDIPRLGKIFDFYDEVNSARSIPSAAAAVRDPRDLHVVRETRGYVSPWHRQMILRSIPESPRLRPAYPRARVASQIRRNNFCHCESGFRWFHSRQTTTNTAYRVNRANPTISRLNDI